MRAIGVAVMGLLLAGTVAMAQPPAMPPLEDTRVGINTLVREDLFAGFIDRDMTRYARGEANIEALLKTRPNDRAELLSWKGGGQIFKASVAREAGNMAEYRRLVKLGNETLAEAKAAAVGQQLGGVSAITGGSLLLFADKLAPEDRAAAWARAYEAYQFLWVAQGPVADKLPPHIRGELMAGLTQTAQRTGKAEESAAQLEKMLVLMKDTPYEATALAWKANPKAAATSSLGCKNCHDTGRLAPTIARLAPKAS